MKKTLFAFSVIGLLSFVSEKYYTIKFSENQLGFHWKNIEKIKNLIDESNMPHAQAKYIISSLDSLQKDIQKNIKIDSLSMESSLKKK